MPKGQNRCKSVLIPVNDDGYGEGEDEDAAEGAEAADQLAGEGGGGELPIAGGEKCFEQTNVGCRSQKTLVP